MKVRLSSDEMERTLVIFQRCYQQTFDKQTEKDQAQILIWIVNNVNLSIPCFSLRPDAAIGLNGSIFDNAVIRDFCLNLSFRFFTMCHEADDFVCALAYSLADGLAVDRNHFDLLMIPEKIAESMPDSVFEQVISKSWFSSPKSTVEEFLFDNKLFMVCYLIYLTDIKNTPLTS